METAVGITVASDDDASVKSTIRILTQYCFQLFEYYISYFLIVFLLLVCNRLSQNGYR